MQNPLGFIAAFYLIAKPIPCLLFHLKIAPDTLPGSGVCLPAPSWLLSAAQVGVSFVRERSSSGFGARGKMLLFLVKARQ